MTADATQVAGAEADGTQIRHGLATFKVKRGKYGETTDGIILGEENGDNHGRKDVERPDRRTQKRD